MRKRERRTVILSVALLGAFPLGCFSSADGDGSFKSSAPAKDVVNVDLNDGSMASVFPALFQVQPDASVLSTFAVVASRGNDTWRVYGQLDNAMVSTGNVTFSVASGVLTNGQAAVSRGDLPPATTGTVTVVFSRGKISGTVQGAADAMNGTFAGDLAVECEVPSTAFPGASTSGTSDVAGASQAYVTDEKFVTPACAPFKRLSSVP